MAEFNRNTRFSGPRARPSSKGRPSAGESYDAECAACHQRCQVPFRPNGKKPVYCANCFVKDEGRDASPRSYGNAFKARSSYVAAPAGVSDRQIQELKKQIETMNGTLERLVTAVDTFNRNAALSEEVRRHLPTEKTSTEKE